MRRFEGLTAENAERTGEGAERAAMIHVLRVSDLVCLAARSAAYFTSSLMSFMSAGAAISALSLVSSVLSAVPPKRLHT